MTLRLIFAIVAAAVFILAGFTAMNEASGSLHNAYLFFGLAMAVSVVALALPSEQKPN